MKIKFLKEYRAVGCDTKYQAFYSVGRIADFSDSSDSAQWLIDNGFAEEVKESSWWKPKYDEEYFCIGHDGFVHPYLWESDPFDNGRLKLGLVFKTEEAGIRCRDYLQAIAIVRQDEGVIDLQGIGEEYNLGEKYDDFFVYTIACDLKTKELTVIDGDTYILANAIWFDTKEHAQASLDKHPDEWKTIANYDWSRE